MRFKSKAAAPDQEAGEGEALSLSEVRVCYGSSVAVEHASFSVQHGECVAIIGPNGSGKSTIGMAIAGLLPYTGHIRAMGKDAPSNDAKWMSQHGVILVPEHRWLYTHMSVQDNILLGCYTWTHNQNTAKKSQSFLQAFEYFPELQKHRHQKTGTLSGGQQQMVALARGLASRPRLLIIDEPCLGLAEVVSIRLYELLETLTKGGQTVLLIEENPERALQVADRSIRVERGMTREMTRAEMGVSSATGEAVAR